MNPPVAALSESWTNYLPSVLQLPQVYWIGAFSIAFVGFLRNGLPVMWRASWVIQIFSGIFSVAFAMLLLGRTGFVYAVGAGTIASWGATSFYDLIFVTLEKKVRAILGIQPPSPEAPVINATTAVPTTSNSPTSIDPSKPITPTRQP